MIIFVGTELFQKLGKELNWKRRKKMQRFQKAEIRLNCRWAEYAKIQTNIVSLNFYQKNTIFVFSLLFFSSRLIPFADGSVFKIFSSKPTYGKNAKLRLKCDSHFHFPGEQTGVFSFFFLPLEKKRGDFLMHISIFMKIVSFLLLYQQYF